jgi:hypothetical protein
MWLHVGVILTCLSLHHLFVHMLVNNEQLLMTVLLHIWKARHKVLENKVLKSVLIQREHTEFNVT